MIVGFPPFYTGKKDPGNKKMYDLIKNKPVFFPNEKEHGTSMSDNCKDFISKCLTKTPQERLGTEDDVKEILAHPWFSDIDVKKLVARQIETEFKPKLSEDALDISNFNKKYTSREAIHSELPIDTQKKIEKENDKDKF